MASDSDVINNIQWAVSAVLGFFSVIYGSALLKLYSALDKLRESQEKAAETARTVAEHGDRDIWEAIERLRTAMEEDQRRSAKSRQELIASMVTKAELREQIDRVVSLLRATGHP